MEDLSTVGLESEEAVKKWKKEERENCEGAFGKKRKLLAEFGDEGCYFSIRKDYQSQRY
jgi:hypothetical protein